MQNALKNTVTVVVAFGVGFASNSIVLATIAGIACSALFKAASQDQSDEAADVVQDADASRLNEVAS